MTLNGLPLRKMKKGEGIDFHSLVEFPAIEKNFMMFSKKERYKFNQEKQIITGPFMVPDLPIYRNDATYGEYYVFFDKQTIVELNEQFMTERKTLSFNYQHKDNSQVNGAVLVENWIVGENDNKAKDLGFDVPVGTWMGSVKINNKEFWDSEIKSGNAKGFSIEGYLDMEMKKLMDKKTLGKIQKYDVIKRAQNNDLFINGELAIGNYVYYSQPQIVLIGTEQQELRSPIWENNVSLADGRVLELSEGKIVQIIEASKAQEHLKKYKKNKFMEAKTKDGAFTITTSADTFAVGADVTVTAQDGTVVAPTDTVTSYDLENGSTIDVVAGKITEVADTATDNVEEGLSEAEVSAMSKLFAKVIESANKPLLDKITALETKLSNMPGAPSATSSTDKKGEAKPTPAQTALAKINKIKELNKTAQK